MTKNQTTLTKKLEIAQRRNELSRLVSQGVRRHADLAQRLGVSEKTGQRDLEELDSVLREQSAQRIVELQDRERMVSFQRIEDLIMGLEPLRENKRTRIQATRLVKELEERRSKLLGLDMPSKHASTDPTGQHEYGKIPDEFKLRSLLRNKRRSVVRQAEDIVEDGVAEIEAGLN